VADTGYYDTSYPPSLWGGGADPAITTLVPSTVSAAAGPTTIQVNGTNFVSGSVVEVNQVAQPTTFVSATRLTISYDPSTAGTVQFTVRNPNEEESNSVAFVVGALGDDLPEGAASYTIAQLQEWTDDHADLADEVLAVEEARGELSRVTLVDWLRGFIAHRDEDTET